MRTITRAMLRRVPRDCRTALDVGCGLGAFAQRLARRGIEVEAVDPSEDTIAAARSLTPHTTAGGIRFLTTDVTTMDLEPGRYDFISCLASIHHVPFDTVTRLRRVLAPGGVLAGRQTPTREMITFTMRVTSSLRMQACRRVQGRSERDHFQLP